MFYRNVICHLTKLALGIQCIATAIHIHQYKQATIIDSVLEKELCYCQNVFYLHRALKPL